MLRPFAVLPFAGILHLQNLHERHEVGEEPNQQDEKYLHELALK